MGLCNADGFLHLRVDRMTVRTEFVFRPDKVSNRQRGARRVGRDVCFVDPSAEVVWTDDRGASNCFGVIEEYSPDGMASSLEASDEVFVFTAILLHAILHDGR